MALELYHPGLEGVIAGETNISSIDGDLLYRGYSIGDLTDGATFLEVAHLLLVEELPNQEQLADFRSVMLEESELPQPVEALFRDLPLHVPVMDVLRTGVSLLGQLDPQVEEETTEAGIAQSIRLLARLPLLIAAWMRLRDGLPTAPPCPTLGYAGNLLRVLQGQDPEPIEERALDAALVLAADHGFETATFTARVAASSRADAYSAVTAAMAVAASSERASRFAAVMEVLAEVGSPERAGLWVQSKLRCGEPLPGFETGDYAVVDPRAALLERNCGELAEACRREDVEEVADATERAVWQEVERPPALDWPLARLLDYLGLEPDLHLPVFLCGRLAGWCAHIIEQAESEQTFHPRARYRGVERRTFETLVMR